MVQSFHNIFRFVKDVNLEFDLCGCYKCEPDAFPSTKNFLYSNVICVCRITMDPSISLPPFADVQIYSDVSPHHEIDTDRPYAGGLDDSHRPTLDCEYLYGAVTRG
jgi:hypothetical protein